LSLAADDPNTRNIKKLQETRYDPLNEFARWWNSRNLLTNYPNAAPKTENDKNSLENKPKCSQEQIYERLAICNSFEFYENNTCLKCGCALSREKNFMNKLYWPDKSCPIGKWGPVKVKDRK
jgi:hypothetical protein